MNNPNRQTQHTPVHPQSPKRFNNGSPGFNPKSHTDTLFGCIACTYAMLAAESLGLGTTIIGAAAPVIQRNKNLCRTLGIPEKNTPSIALILGHRVAPFKKNHKTPIHNKHHNHIKNQSRKSSVFLGLGFKDSPSSIILSP